MSEPKHTPGEWRVHESFPCLIVGPGLGLIARADVTRLKKSTAECCAENEANASLIAAAPELLEALKALLADHVGCAEAQGHGGPISDAYAALRKAGHE